MTDTEALELIFRPGFSTAEEITEISGRGVGLDVVQSVLHRLKGSVSVETRPGQGTTFRLKLPLTLAIIKALLFRVEAAALCDSTERGSRDRAGARIRSAPGR